MSIKNRIIIFSLAVVITHGSEAITTPRLMTFLKEKAGNPFFNIKNRNTPYKYITNIKDAECSSALKFKEQSDTASKNNLPFKAIEYKIKYGNQVCNNVLRNVPLEKQKELSETLTALDELNDRCTMEAKLSDLRTRIFALQRKDYQNENSKKGVAIKKINEIFAYKFDLLQKAQSKPSGIKEE